MVVSFGNVVQISVETIEFISKTVVESGLMCIVGYEGWGTHSIFPYSAVLPPVFSLYTDHACRIRRKYGANQCVFTPRYGRGKLNVESPLFLQMGCVWTVYTLLGRFGI